MNEPKRTAVVRCCIVGAGPAGVMLGYLLARQGHTVAILEKHADFLRDFRGDTVHPSTMTVLDELGLLGEFLQRPHSEVRHLAANFGSDTIELADLTHVPGPAKFIAFMPQWDFLNFLAEKGRAFAGFTLLMNTQATDVVRDGDRVIAVHANSPDGPVEIRADLFVACDGRTSTMRSAVQLTRHDLGAPMDVLWMRLSKKATDRAAALGFISAGAILVFIDRRDYWQCGFVIAKGAAQSVRARGIESFRQEIATIAPFAADRVDELQSWDDVKLLSVTVDRLDRWYVPGMLFIGDAAHAMSPAGGVGINLAIQDAVATANTLRKELERPGPVTDAALSAVQRRRMFPTVMTQALQVFIQRRIIASVLRSLSAPRRTPAIMRFLTAIPGFRRIPAYMVGIGFRPEHVER